MKFYMNVNQCIVKNSHYVQIPEIMTMTMSMTRMRMKRMTMMTMKMTPKMMRMKNLNGVVAILDSRR